MPRIVLLFASAVVLLTHVDGLAQSNYDAQWIWYDEGNPAESAPTGKVWFRHMVRSDSPSTGAARIVCDDPFVLWVNGRRIGEGQGGKLYRFNLSGIVGRGPNVVAVEADNKGGRAGLFIDGEVRTQGGHSIPFDTGPAWRATRTPPKGDAWTKAGYDVSAWKPVKVIGPHANSPWNQIELRDTYLDRFQVAEGFQLQRVAEPDLVGSIVAITWGNRGRLIASRERGPILSVIDSDGDGRYDRVVEYSNQVTNCQGLCMVFDDLYAVGDGPQGTGVYRLPDRNHDDRADEVVHILSHKGGMGEHGPHDVIYGPDGWLYHNMGNHAWVTAQPEPTTPVRKSYEGYLLQPKFEDARGHARGIPVPGGTIWRFTPDGKKWWLETAGFRNEYDFAFDEAGNVFSFDSDMEWDVGMPWYRPVRVTHCVPGAEFGWRSGAAKWPAYYFDSLPGTVAIGRGSPTGVVFYNHRQFPQKYHGAFLICDWSMGRIMAVFLKPDGATFTGNFENLVTGNPLNVSDIEVARDGSVVFSTGGRNTEGGIYRVSYSASAEAQAPSNSPAASADDVDDLLDLPQLQAAWAREIAAEVKQKAGDDWEKILTRTASTGSPAHRIRALTLLSQLGPKPPTELLLDVSRNDDPQVRAFSTFLLGDRDGSEVQSRLVELLSDEHPAVRRRACEALVRSGLQAPAEKVIALLSDEDSWIRFAARHLLERLPIEAWREQVLSSSQPHVVTHGLLALYRLPEAFDGERALRLSWELLSGQRGALDRQQKLDVLRMIQLALLDGARAEVVGDIAEKLLAEFPTGDADYDAESARILAAVQHRGATAKFVAQLASAETQAQQIHYALCLRYLKVGWNTELKQRLLEWYEGTRDWEGGASFVPYLANIVGATLEVFRPDERKQFLLQWKERPFSAGLLLRYSGPRDVADYDEVIGLILEETREAADRGHRQLVSMAFRALGHSDAPEARETLRRFYDTNADQRGELARAMAENPKPGDAPYFLRTLRFADPTTAQLSLSALQKLRYKPQNPDEIREVILAGLKLGNNGGLAAVRLLQRWTGSRHQAGRDIAAALVHYQQWYAKRFPDAPPAELPKVDAEKTKYTYQQLMDMIERRQAWRQGDVARGRKVFQKANCIKCHRFGNEGENVGPDLTSLRRRFQRKEVIESLLFPSQVISDQYRMVTVVTNEGLVHNGMPIPDTSNNDKLVLLLQDATRLEIPRSKIALVKKSNTSVMPVGVLKELSPEEIVDLFAFLETSIQNEPTPPNGGSKPAAGAGQE